MILSLLSMFGCGEADPAPVAGPAAAPAEAPAGRAKAGKGGKARGGEASAQQTCAAFCARFGACTGIRDVESCTAGCLAELPLHPKRYGCASEASCLDFGLCQNRCDTQADCPGGSECAEVTHHLCDGAGGPNTECSGDSDCKPGQTCRHIPGKSCVGGDY